MAIPDSDPRARELDAAFEAAANGPAKPRAEAKTPAEIDPEAPFGRDEKTGEPNAPYGTHKDGPNKGKPKRSAGGRPPGHPNGARTVKAGEIVKPGEEPKGKYKPEPHDWTGDLDGAGTAVWFGLSAIAKIAPKIPFVSKLIPEQKLAAEAFILSETQPRLVAAVNLAAQHNASAEKFCKRLKGEDGLWALTCMFMVMPVLSIAMTVWKADPVELKELELPALDEMAKRNDGKMDEMIAKINAQIAAATEAAMPQEPAAAA